MDEYFFLEKGGKAGILVITKTEESKFEVESVIQIFDNCMQNNFAVASIVEHLLNTIKQESPQMKFLNFKSDNAGCCNSGPLLLSLPITGKANGYQASEV